MREVGLAGLGRSGRGYAAVDIAELPFVSVSAAADPVGAERWSLLSGQATPTSESVEIEREEYRRQLAGLQAELARLQPRLLRSRHALVVVIEGDEGTGRRGITDRLIKRLDRRTLEVHSKAEPTPRERAYHPLWRFWMQLPPRGHIGVFEHSWHSELLLERLEGLRPLSRWHRSCREAGEFERWLADDGAVLVKLYLQSVGKALWSDAGSDTGHRPSPAWRTAADELIARTHHEHSPWQVVPVTCKRSARLEALRRVLAALHGLGLG